MLNPRYIKWIAAVGICLLLALASTPLPTQAKMFRGINDAVWSPNGSRIAFAFTDATASYSQALYVMNVESITPTKLTTDVESFAWSPDGSQLAVTHYNGSGITLMDSVGINGAKPTQVSSNGRWPVWSADGKQLFYYLGGKHTLSTINVDGSDPTPFIELKDAPSDVWSVKWSADRQSVALTAQGSTTYKSALYVADKNGMRRLHDGEYVGQVSWSPDGKQLVTESDCKHLESMCIYDVATGTAHYLGAGASPLWSPDGKRIAFTLNSQVCVINVDGSDKRCLTEKQQNNMLMLHSWAPNSRRLLFSRGFAPSPNTSDPEDFRFEYDAFILDVERSEVRLWFDASMITEK